MEIIEAGILKFQEEGEYWLISAILKDGKPTTVATSVKDGQNGTERLQDHKETMKDHAK